MADAALATRLVLAPRATRLPASAPDETDETDPGEPEPGDTPPDQQPPSEPPDTPADEADPPPKKTEEELGEMLLAAAMAAIPDGLLARLRAQDFRQRPAAQGREGARQKASQGGRPVGVRAAAPSPGLRLNLIETLRAAAPWQRLRAAENANTGRVHLRREDFRVTITESRGSTTTIFVVDASGSSALNRLAEAKGAVELLLADCYRRRDQVAVIAFRGKAAQILLPPTRSLVRAKRSLAALPGGGGTPLAAGIDAGLVMAQTVRRGGATPTIVLLTDGRANVTRAGTSGRDAAANEAEQAGRLLRAAGIASLVLDTSPRPAAVAHRLAASMGALYVPLPYANAANVSAAVRAAGRTP
jgi:magnesium chelatase subunit D